MLLVHKDFSDLFVRVVDCSLQGSEYGLEAWQLLKKHILSGSREISLDDLERLEELIDLAMDDIEGPEFRIDLSLDKMYA